MPRRGKMKSLSIHLLKQGVASPDAALKAYHDIRQLSIGHGRGAIGNLYYRMTPAHAPRWLEFFSPHVNPNDFLSSSAAAVLIVSAGGRMFALTFGHGWHLLKPGSFEENFGLRVTLNSVSPDEVRTIDRKALDSTGRHSREQASKNIAIIEFGLDIDKDILLAVTGPPEDPALGRRLAGADSLSIVADISLTDLRDRLPIYLAQYRKRIYRERFPWVENIREVGDLSLRGALDSELEKRIKQRRLDRIWMAVPDLVDWHDVAGFVYSRAESADLLDDINFESYLEHLRHPDALSIGMLRQHRVYCISAETDQPKIDWPVYKCIYAEIDRSGRTFLLNGERWYEVASGYVEDVNRAISRIPKSSILHLPEYDDANEEEYNKRVHESNPLIYALMDRRTVNYGGGSSRIEFCDLYTRQKTMVHVKRYGGSGTLSHLFAQGSVSATLFLNDQRFRRAVNNLLPATHQIRTVDTQPRASDYEVAYVVASKHSGPLVLPFFSRVTLRSVYTQLQNMGYRVTLTKVNVAR